MIEPGVYTGVFREVEVGKSPNTGTPCVATVWYIEEEDIERTVYTYINKNTMKTSFKKLDSIGFNGDFNDPAVEVEKVDLRCTHSEYDGKEREKWDFAAWGGVSVEKTDTKTIRELNAMWKKEVGSSPKPKAKAAQAPAKKAKSASEPEPEQEAEAEETSEEKDYSGMTPREIAWESFLEHKASEEAIEGLENGKSAKAAMEWAVILSDAIPDKEEEEFDDEDWENIKIYCETPF